MIELLGISGGILTLVLLGRIIYKIGFGDGFDHAADQMNQGIAQEQAQQYGMAQALPVFDPLTGGEAKATEHQSHNCWCGEKHV